MKKLIYLFVMALLISGCVTAYKINSVSLGMGREEVIEIMGEPVSRSAEQGTECLNYKLYETNADYWGSFSTPYAVCLKDGKVVSYGRHGDFGKINVQTENNGELENKLETLNKLLSDGIITKNEFEEQKKKLLNGYTSKQN